MCSYLQFPLFQSLQVSASAVGHLLFPFAEGRGFLFSPVAVSAPVGIIVGGPRSRPPAGGPVAVPLHQASRVHIQVASDHPLCLPLCFIKGQGWVALEGRRGVPPRIIVNYRLVVILAHLLTSIAGLPRSRSPPSGSSLTRTLRRTTSRCGRPWTLQLGVETTFVHTYLRITSGPKL